MIKGLSRAHVAGFLTAGAAAFTLAGYELLRSPLQTLYKAEFGKDSLPMVMAGLPLSVAAVLYVYARILSWLGARRTLLVTTIGSAALIAGAQIAYEAGIRHAIVFLYLFSSAYVVLLIEQYWSFINSSLTEDLARKLNGPICGIASIGSIIAGYAGSQLTASFGTATMVLFAAGATLPAAFLSNRAYAQVGEPRDQTGGKTAGLGHLALGEFSRHRVLTLLLAIIVVTQVLAAFLSLSFQGVLQDTIPNVDEQTTFSYGFYAWLNAVAAVLQFVVAPLLMRAVSPVAVHIMIPVLHAVALVTYIQSPSLLTIAAAYMCFKTIDYSIFRAAKEVLYVPLPFDARYRAKEVIDVFGYRFSKGVTAGCVTILQNAGMRFAETSYAMAGLGACLVWVVLATPIGRFYRKETPAQVPAA